jgi:hypothetical protein
MIYPQFFQEISWVGFEQLVIFGLCFQNGEQQEVSPYHLHILLPDEATTS